MGVVRGDGWTPAPVPWLQESSRDPLEAAAAASTDGPAAAVPQRRGGGLDDSLFGESWGPPLDAKSLSGSGGDTPSGAVAGGAITVISAGGEDMEGQVQFGGTLAGSSKLVVCTPGAGMPGMPGSTWRGAMTSEVGNVRQSSGRHLGLPVGAGILAASQSELPGSVHAVSFTASQHPIFETEVAASPTAGDQAIATQAGHSIGGDHAVAELEAALRAIREARAGAAAGKDYVEEPQQNPSAAVTGRSGREEGTGDVAQWLATVQSELQQQGVTVPLASTLGTNSEAAGGSWGSVLQHLGGGSAGGCGTTGVTTGRGSHHDDELDGSVAAPSARGSDPASGPASARRRWEASQERREAGRVATPTRQRSDLTQPGGGVAIVSEAPLAARMAEYLGAPLRPLSVGEELLSFMGDSLDALRGGNPEASAADATRPLSAEDFASIAASRQEDFDAFMARLRKKGSSSSMSGGYGGAFATPSAARPPLLSGGADGLPPLAPARRRPRSLSSRPGSSEGNGGGGGGARAGSPVLQAAASAVLRAGSLEAAARAR